MERGGAVVVGQVWGASSVIQKDRDDLQVAIPVTHTESVHIICTTRSRLAVEIVTILTS